MQVYTNILIKDMKQTIKQISEIVLKERIFFVRNLDE